MRKFKTLTVIVATSLIMVACGGNKATNVSTLKSPEEKALACEPAFISQLPRNIGKLYTNGIGESKKRAIAQSKSAMAARNNMTLKLKALIQSFAKNYMREIEVPNGKSETEGLFVQEIMQTANSMLEGSSIVKTKVCLVRGRYMVFSLCELDDGTVEKAVKKTIIKNEDKLKVLFNEQQFRKEMDEQLKKFKEQE